MRMALLSGAAVGVLAGQAVFVWTDIGDAGTVLPDVAAPEVQNIDVADSAEELQRLEDLEELLRDLSDSLADRQPKTGSPDGSSGSDTLICAEARLWTNDTRSTCYVPPKLCRGGSADCNQTAAIWRNETEM